MCQQDHWQYQGPLKLLKQRAFLLSEIRRYFLQKNVLEVVTPILSSAGNTDVQIEMFQTRPIKGGNGSSYLRTSPEFFHKRLLASGSGDIFEIAPVFRAGEISRLHNPEFTLLEWYRMGFDLSALMNEVVELFSMLNASLDRIEIDVEYISYEDLFQQYVKINPFQVDLTELHKICIQQGYTGSDLSRTEALDFIFAIVIQPQLMGEGSRVRAIMVYHFPIEMAALAQVHPEFPDRCLRFEFLWNGVELTNGYQELTDAVEQRARFEHDNLRRSQQGLVELPLDENLLSALEHGLPECSGVALGIERMMMCLFGYKNIQEVLGFDANNS